MKIIHGVLPGQVLQRIHPKFASTKITGTSAASGAVLATLSKGSKKLSGWNKKKVGSSIKGHFTATLQKIPVGGPYELKLEIGKESVRVRDLFAGDVWLMAGQSNMEGVGNLEDAPAPHPLVRAFYLDRHWDIAKEPIHVLAESPDRGHLSLLGVTKYDPIRARKERIAFGKGVGMGIYFGQEMLKRSGVPQGLICTAHGGSSMNQWSPKLKEQGGDSLYGSMMLSMKACGQPVAGVLWYQGESEQTEADAPPYTERMKELVAAFRKDFHQPNLPWIMVQIGWALIPECPHWDSIREQQRHFPKLIKNLDCTASIDLQLDDLIHISAKDFPRLAARMARMADRLVYKNKKELPAPALDRIVYKSSKDPALASLEISFKNIKGKLISNGRPWGFEILNDEKKLDPRLVYKVALLGNKVIVEFYTSPKMSYVQYAYGVMPYANITDERDMPVPAFGPIPLPKK